MIGLFLDQHTWHGWDVNSAALQLYNSSHCSRDRFSIQNFLREPFCCSFVTLCRTIDACLQVACWHCQAPKLPARPVLSPPSSVL